MAQLFPFLLAAAAWAFNAQSEPTIVMTRGDDSPPVWVQAQGTEPGTRYAVVEVEADADGAEPLVWVSQSGQTQQVAPKAFFKKPSSTWIGVRMSPVPAPLAAHIGGDGLMIDNIVRDSPADQAGLQRFDVIVAFDGQQIDNSQDLVGAIADVGAGRRTEIVVVREAQRQRLSISPTERPSTTDWEYKYEELDKHLVEDALRLRGHRLHKGPGGAWIFEELGPLQGVPDVLRRFELLNPDEFDFEFHVDTDALDEDIHTFFGPRGTDDKRTRIEMRVQVDDDGTSTTIWRDADGRINVKSVDPDGVESTETYESVEELEAHDPEAYEKYQQFGGGGGGMRSLILRKADPGQLGNLREKFQVNVERRLREALERAKVAELDTQEAVRKARERMKFIERQVDDATGTASGLSFSMRNGRIDITVEENGEVYDYHFQSVDELREMNPELYERVQQYFE